MSTKKFWMRGPDLIVLDILDILVKWLPNRFSLILKIVLIDSTIFYDYRPKYIIKYY